MELMTRPYADGDALAVSDLHNDMMFYEGGHRGWTPDRVRNFSA